MEYELTAIALLAMIILLLMGIRLGINTIIYFKFGSSESNRFCIYLCVFQLQQFQADLTINIKHPGIKHQYPGSVLTTLINTLLIQRLPHRRRHRRRLLVLLL